MLARSAVHFMAADPQLASGGGAGSSSLRAAAEFRQMVSLLHAQGIEVLLEVRREPCWGAEQALLLCVPFHKASPERHLPHCLPSSPPSPLPLASQVDLTFTAEGTDQHPSSVSLRGLSYGSYYRSNGVSPPARLPASLPTCTPRPGPASAAAVRALLVACRG